MQPLNLTRRGFLATAAIGAPLACAMAAPTVAQPIDTAAWDAALARSRRAEAAYCIAGDHEDAVFAAFFDRCKAIAPPEIRDFRHCSAPRQLDDLPVEDIAALYEPPHTAAPIGNGAIVAAKVAAYRVERDRIRAELGVAEADHATRAAVEETRAAFAALLATPAPTIAALAEKLEIAAQSDLDEDEVKALAADARRLAGEVRA